MVEERKELHLLYRPQSFDEYIGGNAMKEAILACIDRTRVFLLWGPRGCGKTTTARLMAYHLEITDQDIYEIDAADKTGVDDARQIKASAVYAPKAGKRKMYIIDECHRLTGNAWDSLLKTLEKPPNHCYFVLCSTEFPKIPETIKSRCKIFEVKPLMKREAKQLIDWVCVSENINLAQAVEQAIIDQCEGIPREIVIAIDTVRDMKNEEDAISLISSSKGKAAQITDLCNALLAKKKWEEITKILKGLEAEEPESIRYSILGLMNWHLMKGENSQAAITIMYFTESFMYSKRAGLTGACFNATH